MTVDDIQKEIDEIIAAAVSGDIETAHRIEDDLYINTLHAIKDGAPNHTELAAMALKSDSLSHIRLYT